MRQKRIQRPADWGTLFPVYEFRPLDGIWREYHAFGDVLRYAEGNWIPDDGEYDLAFIVPGRCLMVELSYQRNILWKWLTGPWTESVREHPRGGNPWHHMLRDGEAEWGGDWGSGVHPNSRAGDAGMNQACSMAGASSGMHVSFHLGDRHIAAGLVRERETKQVVTFPEKPVCMYCGEQWKARVNPAAA